MQRYYEVVRDGFGNLASGCSATVYLTGTATLATLYAASDAADAATTSIANPIVTTSNGQVAFATADGDYDIVITGSNLPATLYRYRVNLLDGTTVSAAPFSQVALTMPTEFSVAGSPAGASGTLTVSKATQVANVVWAGPASGGATAPGFRALVAADVTPVAVALTTNQTAAGNKLWTGTAEFDSTVQFDGAVTNNSTLAQVGTSEFDGQITLDSDVDIYNNTASPAAGFGKLLCPLDISLGIGGAGTICTAATILTNLRILNFADAATNGVCGNVALPESYAAGTDVAFYLAWTTNGTNTGVVRWGLEYTVITGHNTGIFPATTTIYVETAAQGTTPRLMYSTFADITGTTFLPDTVFQYRLFRDGTHGNDTCTDAGQVLHLAMNYKKTRFSIKNKVPSFYS